MADPVYQSTFTRGQNRPGNNSPLAAGILAENRSGLQNRGVFQGFFRGTRVALVRNGGLWLLSLSSVMAVIASPHLKTFPTCNSLTRSVIAT